MISSMVELQDNVKLFGFYVKPSSGQCDVSSELYSILKWNEKIRKVLEFFHR